MDKPHELMRIAPVISVIVNWATGWFGDVALGLVAECKSKGTDLSVERLRSFRERNRQPTDELGFDRDDFHTPEEWDARPLESGFEHIEKLLWHTDIEHIHEGGLRELREALRILMRSDNPRQLLQAVESYAEASLEFDEHFIHVLPEQLFGDWGAQFFRHLILQRERTTIDNFARAFSYPVKESADEDASAVTIDEERFTVQVGKRKPCFIGYNRQFRLLAELVGNPGRFIPFVDLVEALGGDSFDVSSLAVLKRRLCERLERGGYKDLAVQIVAQPGHYAYQPD